ncbi:MAG: glycosyltransferase family 2 protein [Flavobacteriales bacterium]|nr:glycosyltransferase family 2 protein [Flavobacteriales bacterium]
MKQTAVVILNWNGRKYLEKFLPLVVEHSRELADVVVIDNASKDDSISFISAHFPEVLIIKLEKNHGFAKGYNLGLAQIQHEFLVLLNSDVEVTSGWIEPLVAYMEAEPTMAACQPKILDYNRKTHFEYAGAAGGYMDKDGFVFCAGRIFNEFEEDIGQYTANQEVFWASGAAMFIRRHAYMEVGGLDEDFYAHMEEIDLCWRLKNRGYSIGSCRSSHVYHVGGGTLDRLNPLKTYLNFRNNLYMLLKNYRNGSVLIKLCRRMTLDGIAAFRFLTEGKMTYFLAVLRAHFTFYTKVPLMLRKRKAEADLGTKVNLTGMYKRSIINQFFLKKNAIFSSLKESDFY